MRGIRLSECIGCGYCCMKGPCAILTPAMDRAVKEGWQGCPELTFEEGRHFCGVLRGMQTAVTTHLVKEVLSIGAGCCAGLNSWRREPLIDRR